MPVCLSFFQDMRELSSLRNPLSKGAVKIPILIKIHTNKHTRTHTHIHTQVIQQADNREPVGSNSRSGRCAAGKAGACWIFHYSLIYCLTNPPKIL